MELYFFSSYDLHIYSNLIICILSYIYNLTHLYGIGLTLRSRVSPKIVVKHCPLRSNTLSPHSSLYASSLHDIPEKHKRKKEKKEKNTNLAS